MRKSNIILIGPMGAGKSSIGQMLALYLQQPFIDSDTYLEKKLQLTCAQIFAQYGEKYFREQEAIAVAELALKQNTVIATGGGSLSFVQSRHLLSASGVVCYLQVDIHTQLQRLAHVKNRPTLPPAHMRKHFLESLALRRNYLYAEIADIIMDTSHDSISTLTQRLLQQLAVYS